MLNILRESMKHGAWPKLVLGAVAVGLVAYLGAYFSCDSGVQRGSDFAARINGKDIPIRVFQRRAQQIDQNYRQLLGESYGQFKQQAQIGTRAIQSLVQQELILQDAERLGLTVTPDELVERIRTSEILKDPTTGEFVGKERYVQAIERNFPGGVVAFERDFRNEILTEKWTDLVTQTVSVSEDELIEAYRQRNERTAVDFVVVSSANQEFETKLSDEEVARWYAENQDRYLRDAGRKIRYTVIERRAQTEKVQLSEDEIRASYEQNQANYSHPEQRRASHILFRSAPGASEEDKQAVRAVAESTLQRLQAGEDFAELAKSYSQDPGSAERGGDLGFFARGDMVPPFEEAVFATAVGQLSPVVETTFGYHLILVTEERTAGVDPFEDVADDIRLNLELRRAEELVVSEAQRVRGLLTGAADLDAVAQAEGLEVESRFVTRDDRLGDLGASPDFIETIFDLDPGMISPPLRTARGMAIVAVDELVDSAVAPLDEVEDAVRTDMLNERARQAAVTTAQGALERGGDLAAMAKRLGKEVAASGDLAPGQALPGTGGSTPEMQDALFAAGLMEGDRGVVAVPAGALLFEVTQRTPFDSYAFEDGRADLLRELVEQRKFALRQSILEQMTRVQEVLINSELVSNYDG